MNAVTIDITENQAALLINALEEQGFRMAHSAADLRNIHVFNNSKDLFFMASQYRKAIGWPERDDSKNPGPYRI